MQNSTLLHTFDQVSIGIRNHNISHIKLNKCWLRLQREHFVLAAKYTILFFLITPYGGGAQEISLFYNVQY